MTHHQMSRSARIVRVATAAGRQTMLPAERTDNRSHARTAAPVTWAPSKGLDIVGWVRIGQRLGAMTRCSQWWLGDWIRYGTARWGEKYSEAARVTGYDVQTLRNIAYVAGRVEVSRRRENLSWSHHETLASLKPAEQDHWLDEASKHRWSVSDLRMMLRAARKWDKDLDRAEDGHPAGPPDRPPVQEFRARAQNGSVRNDSTGAGRRADSSAGRAVTCPRCGEQVLLTS